MYKIIIFLVLIISSCFSMTRNNSFSDEDFVIKRISLDRLFLKNHSDSVLDFQIKLSDSLIELDNESDLKFEFTITNKTDSSIYLPLNYLICNLHPLIEFYYKNNVLYANSFYDITIIISDSIGNRCNIKGIFDNFTPIDLSKYYRLLEKYETIKTNYTWSYLRHYYLKPGKYELYIYFGNGSYRKSWDFIPWIGLVRSNTVEFEIVDCKDEKYPK